MITKNIKNEKLIILIHSLFLHSFNHDKMKKLVDFITVMPPEDAGKNRGHK